MKRLQFFVSYGVVDKNPYDVLSGGYDVKVKEESSAFEKSAEITKEIVRCHNLNERCTRKFGFVNETSIVIKVLTRLD